MSEKIWISSVLSSSSIFDKPGTRTKFYDKEWNPAQFKIPLSPEHVYAASTRHKQGYSLKRSEFPEALAVFDEKRFSQLHDIFYAGPFLAVKRKLADVLSRFDLGEGGLIPFPIYKSDLVTPMEGEYFLLNFGARKNSFLPERSEDAQKFLVLKDTGQQIWKVNYLKEDGVVAITSNAREGADLWFEVAAHNKIFMNDALALALQEAGLADDWRLKQCRILETAQ